MDRNDDFLQAFLTNESDLRAFVRSLVRDPHVADDVRRRSFIWEIPAERARHASPVRSGGGPPEGGNGPRRVGEGLTRMCVKENCGIPVQ